MAFTLRRWTGAALAGMALIAAWQLPPEPPGPPATRSSRTEVQRRHAELRREMRSVERALQQIRWVDSLVPLVAETAREGLAVALPVTAVDVAAAAPAPATSGAAGRAAVTMADEMATERVAATSGPADASRGPDADDRETLLARFRRAVRRDADALGPRHPDIVVGYVYQPVAHGLEPGAPHNPTLRRETYAGTRGPTAYCLQVATIRLGRVVRIMRRDIERAEAAFAGRAPAGRLLGPCRFYARYGMPGPRVQAWLESGAVVMATEPGDGLSFGIVGKGPEERAVAAPGWDRRGVFGLRLEGLRPMPLERCLSGEAAACASAFLEPAGLTGDPLPEPGPAMPNLARRWSALDDLRGLLSDLEAELGRDRFARFWTSDLSVREAFEAATGHDLGARLLVWVDRRHGVQAPGPGLPRSAALGGLLAIGLLAALAVRRHRRRAMA